MKQLHQRLRALKQQAAPINYRNLSVNEFGTLVSDFTDSLGKRIVKGYLVMFNVRNLYGEVYIKGCFAKSIQERGPGTNGSYEIKFLNQHEPCDPLSLFDVLKEDDIGLYFETKPLDDVPSADRVLKQLATRTLNNFSIGFDYVWDKMKYDDKTDSIFMYETELYEGSVVTIPADLSTYAIRSLEDQEDLYDETEEFINTLPRKQRMEARKLFARYKPLTKAEPLTTLRNKNEPGSIDYNYLLTNLDKITL